MMKQPAQKDSRGRLVAEPRCGYELVFDFLPHCHFMADHYLDEMLHKISLCGLRAPGQTRVKQITR
jgi:hypothetical protein